MSQNTARSLCYPTSAAGRDLWLRGADGAFLRLTDFDGANEMAISADGKLAAFVVGGNVLVTAIVSKDDQEIENRSVVIS
jgi:hypothetical protein